MIQTKFQYLIFGNLKDIQIHINIKNRSSNVYDIPRIKSGYDISSHKIRFNGHLDAARYQLGGRHAFEKFNHDRLRLWCKNN